MYRRLALRRYRCFRDWQNLDLGSLNLVYGVNSAGKSALVRLLPWLAASRQPGTIGPDFSWDGLQGASFGHIEWRGPPPSGAEEEGWWGEDPPGHDPGLAFALGLDCGLTAGWRLRWWTNPETCTIEHLYLDGPEGRWEASRSERPTIRQGRLAYQHGGQSLPMGFSGLLPAGSAGAVWEPLAEALEETMWLGARRRGPSRHGVVRGARLPLHGDGAGAESMALADPALLQACSTWFEKAAGLSLARGANGEYDRVLVRRCSPPGPDLSFPDIGEGHQQVFPVVVASEALRQRGGTLVVEEPESHLHPRLQADLAQQLADVLVAQPRAQIILETHAETMLLAALQAALVRSIDLRLFWVETGDDGAATVRPIPLNHRKQPLDDTLAAAFDTMGVLRRSLLEARQARAG